ncbi:hypothetical protein AB0A69_20885 [Streptomyces sp. NPDC045431]|uniref:hypothetical protein n=1 Tax=Streptomyces sp. NPDC045431 TaxID=3155613 RepID=UPI0033FA74F3
MRCTGGRWRWCRVVAAVLVLVVGALLVHGSGTGVPHDVVAAAGQGSSCDPFDGEGGLEPGVPPRALTADCLPSAPHTDTRVPLWQAEPVVSGVRPERAPPWSSGPSPVELSILRV